LLDTAGDPGIDVPESFSPAAKPRRLAITTTIAITMMRRSAGIREASIHNSLATMFYGEGVRSVYGPH
jgi:hypothetical protein